MNLKRFEAPVSCSFNGSE